MLSFSSVMLAASPASVAPIVSFGLVADIQYADADRSIGRDYRDSPTKLKACVAWWNREPVSFVIQLGDFVDRGPMQNLETIEPIFDAAKVEKHHVLGNHDFFTNRNAVVQRLGMPSAYYEFTRNNWKFIVLDGMDVSTNGGWPETDRHAVLGRHLLEELTAAHAVNAKPWNGAVGAEQRAWLKGVLAEAKQKNQRSVIFCHMPVAPASCRPEHLLWDHAEVSRILESSGSAVAFFGAHDHKGGYSRTGRIHYVTFPALVEHRPEEACKTVEVYRNRIVIRSLSGGSQALQIPGNQAM